MNSIIFECVEKCIQWAESTANGYRADAEACSHHELQSIRDRALGLLLKAEALAVKVDQYKAVLAPPAENISTPMTDGVCVDARNLVLEFSCRIPEPKEGESILVVPVEFARNLERQISVERERKTELRSTTFPAKITAID